MALQPKRVKTEYFPQIIDKNTANQYYLFLKDNVKWQDGIYSKKAKKITRLAYATNEEQTDFIDEFISQIIHNVLNKLNRQYYLLGSYINYLRNGLDWVPTHSHPDQIQLVISLGETRTLKVGAKEYQMNSGDVIIFGSSLHGVAQEPNITEGRISIATFMLE